MAATFLFIQSSFASTNTFYVRYTEGQGSPKYSLSPEIFCANYVDRVVTAGSKIQDSCYQYEIYTLVAYRANMQEGTGVWTQVSGGDFAATKSTYDCPTATDPTKTQFHLDPETGPSCVSPDLTDCASRVGQKFQTLELCYRVTCVAGWVSQPNGDVQCVGNYLQSSYPIPSPITHQSCQAQFVQEMPNQPLKANGQMGVGQTVIDGFCNVEYEFTGVQGNSSDVPAGTPPSSPVNVTGQPAGTGTGTNGTGTGSTGTNGTGTNGTGTNGTGTTGTNGTGTGSTGTNGTGDGSGNCTPEQAKQGLCGGNGYTGSDECDTPPACSGDTLTCGIILQNWRDICGLVKVSEAQRTAAKAAVTSGNSDYDTKRQAKEAEVLGFFNDFKTSLSGSSSSAQVGSCPSDFSFSLMGKSISIPFSRTCDFFRFLRTIVLIFSYLAAARIVYSAF